MSDGIIGPDSPPSTPRPIERDSEDSEETNPLSKTTWELHEEAIN
jgi:hypothetical protein